MPVQQAAHSISEPVAGSGLSGPVSPREQRGCEVPALICDRPVATDLDATGHGAIIASILCERVKSLCPRGFHEGLMSCHRPATDLPRWCGELSCEQGCPRGSERFSPALFRATSRR